MNIYVTNKSAIKMGFSCFMCILLALLTQTTVSKHVMSIVEALNGIQANTLKWGAAVRFDQYQNLIPRALKSGDILKLSQKYTVPPGEVPLVKAPLLNQQLAKTLPKSCRERDTKLQEKQKLLGHALTAIGQVLTAAINKFPYPKIALETIGDAARLIGDVHATETATRRRLITVLLNTKFIKNGGPKVAAATYLFGDEKENDFDKYVEAAAPLISCASGCIVGSALSGNILEANASATGCPKAFAYLCRRPCDGKKPQTLYRAYRAPKWCVKGICTPPFRNMRARWRISTHWVPKSTVPPQDESVYTDTSSSDETTDTSADGAGLRGNDIYYNK